MPDRTKEGVLLTMAERAGVWVRVYSVLLQALRQPESCSPARTTVEKFVDKLGRKLVQVGLFSREELATIKHLEARAGGWDSSNRRWASNAALYEAGRSEHISQGSPAQSESRPKKRGPTRAGRPSVRGLNRITRPA